MQQTHEGGAAFEHTLNHHLEFFSKSGSLFKNKQSYYSGSETALSLFQKCWIVDKYQAFQLLLWLRDARGGAGNRSGFRECINWLAKNGGAEWIEENLQWIPVVGRWDDLKSLFKTSVETTAALMWAKEIMKGNVLAAKWANRKDFPTKHALGIKKEGDFRKLLANIRKEHIVEHKMSSGDWSNIEYSKVPSVAMARYTNAFNKKDYARFEQFKKNLANNKIKINASILFPHDCIRTAKNGDPDIANAQFDALPNFLENTNDRIIVISDTSGSMNTLVSGSIAAIDISQGLALYCSEKIGSDSPFYKKFIGFSSEGSFKDWNGLSFSNAINDHSIFDRAVGQTKIDHALKLILDTAKFFSLPQNKMPTTLLIVSDMQFTEGTRTRNWFSKSKPVVTEVEKMMYLFETAGYKRPKIIYWNTDGYAGSPETINSKDIAIVSGFSPAILKAIFGGEDFSPEAIMLRALKKYQIQRPEEK